MEDEIKDLIRRWITIGWQKGNSELLDEIHSSDFKDHDPSGRLDNLEGFKEGIRKLYNAFPDFFAEIEDIFVNKDLNKATVRWRGKGTHLNEYLGFKPSGKVIQFKGIELLEINKMKILARWGEWDGISLLEQLKNT